MSVLDVSHERTQLFIDEAVKAGVLSESSKGGFALAETSDDLRKNWERRFHEIFWPAVTTPWKKLGRANALKVWKTSTFALIRPKTEEAADSLCKKIMEGADRYKLLLAQPNAPSMKYPEGWLSGQRWSDEIDERFIEKHAQVQQPVSLSPLERARRQQSAQHAIDLPIASVTPERRNEFALPDFSVAL